MILRTAIVSAMALSFTASLVLADEVLYCVDTDATGFVWDNHGKGTRRDFKFERFTVKITSDTGRLIARMVGDTAGSTERLRCFFDPVIASIFSVLRVSRATGLPSSLPISAGKDIITAPSPYLSY
jgi:hypothetical protein